MRESLKNSIIFKFISNNINRYDNLITKLADSHAHGNKAKAAIALGTDTAISWLKTNFDTEKEHLIEIFTEAAEFNEIEIIDFFLKNLPSIIDMPNAEGNTALIIASYLRHKEIIAKLIKAGCNLNLQNVDGNSALICASFLVLDLDTIKLLLASGADINARNKDDCSVLTILLIMQRIEASKFLLSEGALISESDFKGFQAPLLLYLQATNKSQLSEHIARGANINEQNSEGWTALMIAATRNDTVIVQNLIDLGADLDMQNNNGYTASMLACKTEHEEVLALLINAGANINLRGIDNLNALEITIESESKNLVGLLMAAGADVDPLSPLNEKLLIGAIIFDQPFFAKKIIDAGLDVNLKFSENCITPLMAACYVGNVEIVKLLIDLGADINFTNEKGISALVLAEQSESSNKESIQLLLKENKTHKGK